MTGFAGAPGRPEGGGEPAANHSAFVIGEIESGNLQRRQRRAGRRIPRRLGGRWQDGNARQRIERQQCRSTATIIGTLRSRTTDSPAGRRTQSRTILVSQFRHRGRNCRLTPGSTIRRTPDPAVDDTTVERRPCIDGPAAIGMPLWTNERVVTRLPDVAEVLGVRRRAEIARTAFRRARRQ